MQSDRFPNLSSLLHDILNHHTSNASTSVSGKQSDVDQCEHQFASVKQDSANRIIIPQDDAILGVGIAHHILTILCIKLHRDKSLFLLFVPIHKGELKRARAGKKS